MAKSRPPYADHVKKDPNFKQKAMADWLAQQTGYDVDMKSVQLTLSLTGPWRQSDELKALRDSHVTVRDQKRAEAAENLRRRKAEKAAKLREQLAALEAETGPETPATAPAAPAATPDNVRPLRGAAKKSARAAAPKKAAAKKAPAKKAAAPAAKPAASPVLDDDDDF